MSLPNRTWGVAEFKVVGARQKWRCAVCHSLLGASCELDHRIARWRFGLARGSSISGIDNPDCLSNAQLLCPGCHGEKTKLERIELEAIKRNAIRAAQTEGGDRKRKRTEDEAVVSLLVGNPFLGFAYLSPHTTQRPDPPRTHTKAQSNAKPATQTGGCKHRDTAAKRTAASVSNSQSSDIRSFLSARVSWP
jgi:hypothetical protein